MKSRKRTKKVFKRSILGMHFNIVGDNDDDDDADQEEEEEK